MNSSNCNSNKARWEFLKFKIHELLLNYSKVLAKVRRQEEHNIIYKINKCCSQSVLNDTEKSKMVSLQL